ncbi:acyl transferase [Aspergillus bombycis]|uniref:Acyl transferase n=1 Tax=Aspergillus bombycis TaxID=109264 RepID=A0A1F7ZU75_9EURO|nr:acyl transferase [Aspergillus bombycis]OGM42635.1 acyl transferase [Aspergillus bombycis]
MVHQEVRYLHPYASETSPQEERYRISTLDYLMGLCYTHLAIFFRLDDGSKPKAAAVLKKGLERILRKVGHLCGTIEKWLDAASDADRLPSLNDMENSSFAGITLGDFKHWSIDPMA